MVASTAANSRQEMDFARWADLSPNAPVGENSIDCHLQSRRQLVVATESGFDPWECLLQGFDRLPHRPSRDFQLRLPGGQITELMRDEGSSHADN